MYIGDKDSVNKKELCYLVSKFLMKHRLVRRFWEESLKTKLEGKDAFDDLYKPYNFTIKDDFSTYLYKCVCIYCDSPLIFGDNTRRNIDFYYQGKIYGFFRFVPACGNGDYANFWKKYSDLWMKEVGDTKYVEL